MIGRAAAFLLLFGAAALQAQAVRHIGDLPLKEGRAMQPLPGIETEYGSVRTSEGYRLRTMLTRPQGRRGRLPAIFLTQWVSCGSLDFSGDRHALLRDIARKSGMVLIRVERSGTGDSEGPACGKLDYDTEVRHYREAFDQLSRHDWVDPSRVVILGISLGATTAPLVAAGKKVAGIAVQGGGAVTHVERMINFDRLYLERSGKYPPAAVHEEMTRRIPFHVEYLLGAQTPEEVVRRRPELAGVWESIRGTEPESHYGRPFAWHWQAARKDFLGAWSKLDVPVLVVHGEYDQFEPEHGHRLIAETANRRRPGAGTFLQVAKADHDMESYASAEDAYAYRNGSIRHEAFVEPLIDWLRKVTAPPL